MFEQNTNGFEDKEMLGGLLGSTWKYIALKYQLLFYVIVGRIIKATLSWNRTQAKFCQLITSLSMILLQL